MESLLPRVRSRLFIRANRRVLGLLDGEYRSRTHGRSLDFDELRAYAPGDEVKDIDWKATARHGSTLVRNYAAARRHEVLLVVDTGRNMAAVAESAEPKLDIAVTVAGVLGFLSLRHGDTISLVHGDEAGCERMPARASEAHLEMLLRRIKGAARLDGPASDLPGLLDYTRRTTRGRRIVVIITDDVPFTDDLAAAARRLQARHELLWVTIGDAHLLHGDGTHKPLYEVVDGWQIPDFVRGNARLREEFERARAERDALTERALERLGITHDRVGAEGDVLRILLRMLRERSRARR